MPGVDAPYPPEAVAQRRWWRRGPPLVWQTGPAQGAVFDPATGETHFLSDLPALLLVAVDEQPADIASLIDRIAGPVTLDGHAEAQVAAALFFLESAELVESREMPTD